MFGATLWNILYDECLTLEMLDGVKLVEFVEDIVMRATARNEELLTILQLTLAPEKTNAVFVTKL